MVPSDFDLEIDTGADISESGRGGQIRTDDFLLPKQVLYQAELRPVQCTPVGSGANDNNRCGAAHGK